MSAPQTTQAGRWTANLLTATARGGGEAPAPIEPPEPPTPAEETVGAGIDATGLICDCCGLL